MPPPRTMSDLPSWATENRKIPRLFRIPTGLGCTLARVAMVLSGQDAWRRHPMLSQCAKTPFPAIRPAIAIFLGLVAVDWAYGKIAGDSHHAPQVKVTFTDEGFDGPPSATIKKASHGHGHH